MEYNDFISSTTTLKKPKVNERVMRSVSVPLQYTHKYTGDEVIFPGKIRRVIFAIP